jgi:hypothetical protein
MQQAEQDRKPSPTLLVNTNTPANPAPVSQISCLQEKPGLPVGSVNWTEKGKNTTSHIYHRQIGITIPTILDIKSKRY